ncbi:triose-phosphate isomerase [Carboxydocella sp. ULO1]|uniref:triose-phosphate isomerase n=1 Tax=Carboxydocella sp. ULO1 TaxID=1926599 RepID=UPI0009AD83B2|nr:triose-phosphate isomerase [Carboxydocella sp. ULO1]GAW29808.1 triose-phosphate isomerase [Carboxydocella sp. ULO1]
MRQPIIAGNWKMHKTVAEALAFVEAIKPELAGATAAETVICAPFTALASLAEAVKGTPIRIGAQDLFWEEQGAYTGEISPLMLKELGVSYVIVGHSERRQYFAETDETVNKKVKAALKHGLVPIVCVGETLEQREAGETFQVVEQQTRLGLAGLTAEQVAGLVIAYEPVWAIGTGRTATDADAEEVIAYIRGVVNDLFGAEAAERVRIQYGGSVKPDNIVGLLAQPNIDGALVGGASLDPVSFIALVRR